MTRPGISTLMVCLSICITAGSPRPPRKIISGEHAKESEFPYQVSIQQNEVHICGGSIISETHILTAAHCVIDEDLKLKKGLKVVTGSIDKTKRTSSNVYLVSKQFYHKDYNAAHHRENDIGILKLAKPIKFTANQQKVNLPTSETPDSTEVFMCGWGANFWNEHVEDLKYPRMLRKLPMTVINNRQCQHLLNNQKHFQVNITPSHMCALPKGKAGVCYGDSGGSLTHKNTIIGIISSGVPCGKGFPDIFTRVHKFLPWIAWAMAQ